MYWSVILQQLMIITVITTISEITSIFACLSTGICSCSTQSVTCPCVRQHESLQRTDYVAPYLPYKLPSLLTPPLPSYPASYSVHPYHPVNTAPFANIPYSQTYNLPYTYNALQSYSQEPLVPSSLPSYSAQRSFSNIIDISKNFNSPYHNNFGTQPEEISPNTIEEVSAIFGSQRYGDKYDNNDFQQIQVAPSIISRELNNDLTEMTTEHLKQTNEQLSNAKLPAQDILIVPGQQYPMMVDANLNSHQTTTTATYTDVGAINDSKSYQRAIAIKRNIPTNQQHMIMNRPLGHSRKCFQKKLLPCLKIINKSSNHDNISIAGLAQSYTIENTALFRASNSSKSNADQFENDNKNRAATNAHTLNDHKQSEINLNLNRQNRNMPSVKSAVQFISRISSLQHGNSHDGNKFLQKQQKSNIGENMSQKAAGTGTEIEKHINRNSGKAKFEEVSSNGWIRKNDKLISHAFGKLRELNNAKKWGDYENSLYTAYHHQTCVGRILGYLRNGTIISAVQKCEELDCDAVNVRLSGDRILEIIFLKNIIERFKNYDNYCVSKKSIGEVKFGHLTSGTNKLLRIRRFYNDSIRESNHRPEIGRQEGRIVRLLKLL